MADAGDSQIHQISDELWRRLERLLPDYRLSPKGGRPRASLRRVANGIFHVLATGCRWKALPREFGSSSTVTAYFREWVALGVFEALWREVLGEYDELAGTNSRWQTMDGALTEAPLGGEHIREESDKALHTLRQAFGASGSPQRSSERGFGRRRCA